MNVPPPGIYRHHKGGFYQVPHPCLMTDSMDDTKQALSVRYWSLAKQRWYHRPLDHFMGTDEASGQPRFVYLGSLSST